MSLNALGSGNSGFGDSTKDYNPALLEWFPNRHQTRSYWVQLVCSEFTTLCPKTGQPDIAVLYINYVPAEKMVESKSLKLYLSSFRNHGDFHEDVCNIIAGDLNELLSPWYLEIMGRFNPRGGIAIYPYVCRSRGMLGDDLLTKRRAEFPVIPRHEPVLH